MTDATFHCPEWTRSQGACCPDGAVRHECPALGGFIIPERQQLHERESIRRETRFNTILCTLLVLGTIAATVGGVVGYERHSAWLVDNQEILTLRGTIQ